MKERPKSKWENEDGSINLALVGEVPEYPEVIVWDKEYAKQCDALAEQQAVLTGKRHWGRWSLTTRKPAYLATRSSRPRIGNSPAQRGGRYEIALDRCKTKAERENWIDHMAEKNWISEKSLANLEEAFSALVDEGIIKGRRIASYV